MLKMVVYKKNSSLLAQLAVITLRRRTEIEQCKKYLLNIGLTPTIDKDIRQSFLLEANRCLCTSNRNDGNCIIWALLATH